MYVYWAVYLCASVMAFFKIKTSKQMLVTMSGTAVFLTIFVGYRFEIGVDWHTYELMYYDIYRMPLWPALSYGDPAYSLINWVVSQFDGQIWHVNLICGALFAVALVIFCATLPRPTLAIALSIPTLVIITAMGYTRQSAAIACIMLAYVSFRGTINWRWLTWLCLAALFHKSAIVIFPVFMLSASKNRTLTLAVVGAAGAAILALVVLKGIDEMISLYFEGDLDSVGALPRILIGTVSGIAFLFVRNGGDIFGKRYSLARNLSILSIAMTPLFFIIPSTTVVDRIGILLVPFQGASYAGLAVQFSRKGHFEMAYTLVLVIGYGLMLAAWLMFSQFANYWIPYENVLFQKYI